MPQPDASPLNRLSRRSVRLAALALLTAAGLAVYYVLGDRLSLDYLAQREAQLRAWHQAHPLAAFALAFIIYVVVTGLSIPGALVMTLLIGWLFGFLPGVLLVSFASTAGATLAFLISRFLLRDFVQRKFGHRLQRMNDALRREGAFYLFSLRLIPPIPFFVINLVMGLTPIRTRTFWWVSQLGMLPATAVFVYTGASVPRLEVLAQRGTRGLLKPELILALVLVGLLPLFLKRLLGWYRGEPLAPQK